MAAPIVVELRQAMEGITVTGSIAIEPAAFVLVPEVSSALSQAEDSPSELRAAVNERLRSALLVWLAQGHAEALESLHGVACDLLQKQLDIYRNAARASVTQGSAS